MTHLLSAALAALALATAAPAPTPTPPPFVCFTPPPSTGLLGYCHGTGVWTTPGQHDPGQGASPARLPRASTAHPRGPLPS